VHDGGSIESKTSSAVQTGCQAEGRADVREIQRLILHSDRGAEYTSPGFGDHLHAMGMLQGATRDGAPEDNPHAESFFHSLKGEAIHGVRFPTDASLRTAIDDFVRYYNCQRLHSSLGYRPPIEVEAQAAQI
jgi:putative transposase